jgi:serine/threonine protein kinase
VSSLVAGATLCDDRYRLDGVIGRGGMAIVWRATDLQLEREVAIKVISDVLAGDPRFVARFEREARLAAGLSHPNLVKVFDFSIEEERPFLIMELVGGGTLAEARGRRLDVASLARELLDAVAHIHGAGIIHRDIKPANVLLAADGSPRLTDFGIARGEETTGLTQTGQVLGTLRYIAPEVAAGEPATVRSDLYSLGVLLGELTGDRSEPLSRLLARMTDRDPARRPASAGEALAELDPTRMLGTEPEPEGPTAPLPGGQTPYTGVSYGSERGQTPLSGMRVERRSGVRPPFVLRGFSVRRVDAVAGGLVLLVLLVLVIAAASGGGDDSGPPGGPATTTQLQPARAGAPADAQIDRLEQIVRSARKP